MLWIPFRPIRIIWTYGILCAWGVKSIYTPLTVGPPTRHTIAPSPPQISDSTAAPPISPAALRAAPAPIPSVYAPALGQR